LFNRRADGILLPHLLQALDVMGNLMTLDSSFAPLFKLLDKAEQLAGHFSGGHSGQFLSAKDFHSSLRHSIDKLKRGDNTQIEKLYIWFLPTSSWDDFVGIEGEKIGNELCELLTTIRNGKQ